MKRIILPLTAASLLLAGPALAAGPTCAVADYARQAQALVAPYVDNQAFTGSILVAKDGVPLLRQGYAFADREWNVPNTPGTKFRVGSITKQFTAVAIMLLAEDGKLSISDPVSKYFPDAPASWSKVTIEHLLTHTSGIPSYTSIPGFFDRSAKLATKPQEIVKLTADKPLEFEPGSRFAYDNTGYVLLGVVIEKVSGLTYADFLRQRVLDPLGLKDTGYDDTLAVLPHRAHGYQMGRDGQLHNTDYLDMSVPYAAGSLYSTVDDLSKWDRAIVAGKLLKPASWSAIFADHGHGYGYGWFLNTLDTHKRIEHGGGINGFSAAFQRFPTEGLTVVVLGNAMSAQSGRLASQLAQLCFGEYKPIQKVVLPPADLDRYVGDYVLGPDQILKVWRANGRMLTQVTDQPPVEVFPTAPGVLVAGIADAKLTFKTDAPGPATAVVISQYGHDTTAQRASGK